MKIVFMKLSCFTISKSCRVSLVTGLYVVVFGKWKLL